jgi:hypothetical protein
MLAIRQKKNVIDKKVIVEIPDSFGDEVEIIILSDADENKTEEYNLSQKNWDKLTVKEFFAGYNDKDSIYDNIEK